MINRKASKETKRVPRKLQFFLLLVWIQLCISSSFQQLVWLVVQLAFQKISWVPKEDVKK
jgi:hypothetical protein